MSRNKPSFCESRPYLTRTANAGIATYAPFGKITEEHYDEIFDINVKGLLFTVQKTLSLMPDGGSIIPDRSFVTGTALFVDGGLAQV